MKKLFLIAILHFYILGNAQEFKGPNDYMTFIGKETDLVTKSIWQYTSAIAHSKNLDFIGEKRFELLKNTKKAKSKIASLTNGFNGDLNYKNQILDYLDLIEKQINMEFDKVFEIQKPEEKSYEEVAKFILERNLLNVQIKDEIEKLNTNQKLFASKYGIAIIENKSDVTQKMKTSIEVFEYHTQFYLIYYRINAAESDVMKSIARNDERSTKINLQFLSKYSDEGLEKISKLSAFKDDAFLIEITQKLLEFTKRESQEFGTAVLDYMNAKQKFENLKVNSNQESLSQQESENYNLVVNEKNNSLKKYMRINTNFNDEREAFIKSWNAIGDDFITNHIPAN